jgi:AcrR family transcriptional regulator
VVAQIRIRFPKLPCYKFGTREALIADVVTDQAAERLNEIADQALAFEDPWSGFAYYIETLCELQVTDLAVADAMCGGYPGAERLMAVCGRSVEAGRRIIERARQAGALRPDFTSEDLVFVLGSNAPLIRATTDVAPGAWRRNLAFVLDGLRAEAARQPLPAGPLSPPQVYAVMANLTPKP